MAIIRFATGTTAQWQAVQDQLILKEREVAVEMTEDGFYLMRQGDGTHKFFELPIIVNNKRYEDILAVIEEKSSVVTDISDTIHQTIEETRSVAERAEKAAQDCEDIAIGNGYVLTSSVHEAGGVAGLDEHGYLFGDQIDFTQFTTVSATEPTSLETGGLWEKSIIKGE